MHPAAGVLRDFWQADDDGAYDVAGYSLLGHRFTDATGAYTLSTVGPGLYPGRTRHLHVKAGPPGTPRVSFAPETFLTGTKADRHVRPDTARHTPQGSGDAKAPQVRDLRGFQLCARGELNPHALAGTGT